METYTALSNNDDQNRIETSSIDRDSSFHCQASKESLDNESKLKHRYAELVTSENIIQRLICKFRWNSLTSWRVYMGFIILRFVVTFVVGAIYYEGKKSMIT